jgi:hypothetical protein
MQRSVKMIIWFGFSTFGSIIGDCATSVQNRKEYAVPVNNSLQRQAVAFSEMHRMGNSGCTKTLR